VTGRLWGILPTVLMSCLVVSISLDLPPCWHTVCSRHQYEASRLGFGGGLPWLGHVTYMGEKRNAYRIVIGKSERKKPLLDRLRCRHEDDNKMDYR